MGRISDFFFGTTGGALPLAVATGAPIGNALVAPWSDQSSLAHIAYSDIFTGGTDVVTREVAMTVAPVFRGRAIITGKLADLPLISGNWVEGEFVAANRQPSWLTSSKTVVSPYHRMLLTLDDLLFYGWSLWAVQRSEAGTILDARRVAPHQWAFDSNTPLGIRVNNQPVTDRSSVILFAGPSEGLLQTAADTIRGARAMEKAWVGRVQNPLPMTVLHEVASGSGGTRITPQEAQEYVDAWSQARTSVNGAVGFLPATLNMETYGEVNADLFENGRNQIRLDIANFLNLPASLLDGSANSASLTYVTREGERQELVEWLEFWLAPIEARLSMDDVTPHGQFVRFDRSNLTVTPNQSHGPALGNPEPATETPDIQEASS
ncbi:MULTISPECIES: phage portal protein [unclassified Microbacterium]|uniref:phage portal protein n=1 Tax=unclassified Microbacterium TaxID=2609290 RepID=UPI00214B453B|nr:MULTISPECIES: phage portal protein [unclassified Microbacterium]MCR2785432.1 phage portal protein [Microbacterium sp. zg.B96]WIM14541.1 phage portal protein [Microbacterium sp. zg-B96]